MPVCEHIVMSISQERNKTANIEFHSCTFLRKDLENTLAVNQAVDRCPGGGRYNTHHILKCRMILGQDELKNTKVEKHLIPHQENSAHYVQPLICNQKARYIQIVDRSQHKPELH
jgi:hypothetical protein